MSEVRDVLERTLAFYDDHAWIRGQNYSMTADGILTGACLQGACLLDHRRRAKKKALDLLLAVIQEKFPERLFGHPVKPGVWHFNDSALTDREDVLLVIRQAIAKAENESHDRQEQAG